jgi:FKBP-type peptidyl-prolyl cis-trans isomerase FklB
MRRIFLLLVCFTLTAKISVYSQQIDTTSYSIGMSVGNKMLNDGITTLEYESFLKGVIDMIDKKDPLITKAYSDSLNYEYFQKQREIMITMQKEKGIAFLEENAKRPEVTVTETGLQYEVLTAGAGDYPSASSTVTVHYVGKLISGEEFDSSVKRGQPATFPLNRVIAGWTEGVQLMPLGSKYRFYIPSELGYGSRGAGAAIPPHSTLIFDVELLEIK